ncbi:MAG: hypothetical protein QM658_10310 [Gordonia sp. (in: high G+C Gram-positive bacteria)]
MTVDNTSAPDDGAFKRALDWVRHSLPVVLVVVAVLRIAGWFGFFPLVGTLALGIVVVVQIVDRAHRESGLCMRCYACAPLDGSLEAARRRPVLRLFHLWATRRGLGVYGLTVITPLVLVAVYDGPQWWMIPSDVALLGTIAISYLHHRLQPWCPYCRRWDDGGEREPSPDPIHTRRIDV